MKHICCVKKRYSEVLVFIMSYTAKLQLNNFDCMRFTGNTGVILSVLFSVKLFHCTHRESFRKP